MQQKSGCHGSTDPSIVAGALSAAFARPSPNLSGQVICIMLPSHDAHTQSVSRERLCKHILAITVLPVRL